MSLRALAWAIEVETSATNKLVLIVLANHVGRDSGEVCWPSVGQLAKVTSLAESTVRRAVRDLEEEGLVRAERQVRADGGQSSNRYFLVLPETTTPPTGNRRPPHREPEGVPPITGGGKDIVVESVIEPDKEQARSFGPEELRDLYNAEVTSLGLRGATYTVALRDRGKKPAGHTRTNCAAAVAAHPEPEWWRAVVRRATRTWVGCDPKTGECRLSLDFLVANGAVNAERVASGEWGGGEGAPRSGGPVDGVAPLEDYRP